MIAVDDRTWPPFDPHAVRLLQVAPTDADLKANPLIGGSKGTTMAGVSPDELEESEGANAIEGEEQNDTNRQGGIDKTASRSNRRTPHI